MITTLVQFKLPVLIADDQAKEMFWDAAPKFRNLPGLIRKYFLLSEDGTAIRGVYLWKSRKDAESYYNSGFSQWIVKQFGSEPSITYFISPVIVDNLTNEVVKDD